ncbi:Uncharacterised protein [Enterobacter cloacae]|nr:Uncharacterised protein [Enterobacter cloacae]
MAKLERIIQQIGHYPAQCLGAGDDRQTCTACMKLHVFTNVLIITGDAVNPRVQLQLKRGLFQ